MIKVKLSPFLKDVFFTACTSIITVASMIIVTRLLAHGLGPDQFGAYSLVRRVVSILVQISTLSMGVGLARYLGISQFDPIKKSAYLLGAVGIASSLTILVILVGLLSAPTISFLLFHKKEYEFLFQALLFMLAGFSMTRLLYAYYRGLGRMDLANLWQFGVMAIGLLVVSILFAGQGNAVLIVFLFGGLYMLALPLLFFHSLQAIKRIKQPRYVSIAGKELFKYGLPRIPEGLFYGGLLSIGPLLAPHFGSLKDAGFLAVGQSLFRITESIVIAFGLVALPKIAYLASEKKDDFIRERLVDLITFLFQVGLFVSLHLCLWSDLIVKVWLGDNYIQTIPLMRIIVLALIPYLAFVMLRSVLDAVEVKAINALNLFISLIIGICVAVFLSLIGTGTIGLAIGTMLGFWMLGILTVSYLWRRYGLKLKKKMIWITSIINILFISLGIIIHEWLLNLGEDFKLLGLAFLFECVFLTIYILLLWMLKAEWIRQIRDRMFFEKE